MKLFSQRLQYVMDYKKIVNAELARGIGVQGARITGWLNGSVKQPHRKTLLNLSDFFECDFGWLKDGVGEPYPEQHGSEKVRASLEQTYSLENGVVATISPGDQEKLEKLKQISSQPIMTDTNLKLFIGWLNEYFADNPGQTISFIDQMRKDYESFDDYILRQGIPEKRYSSTSEKKKSAA